MGIWVFDTAENKSTAPRGEPETIRPCAGKAGGGGGDGGGGGERAGGSVGKPGTNVPSSYVTPKTPPAGVPPTAVPSLRSWIPPPSAPPPNETVFERHWNAIFCPDNCTGWFCASTPISRVWKVMK